jgi:tetratricopeptide (TPR) repeat protein
MNNFGQKLFLDKRKIIFCFVSFLFVVNVSLVSFTNQGNVFFNFYILSNFPGNEYDVKSKFYSYYFPEKYKIIIASSSPEDVSRFSHTDVGAFKFSINVLSEYYGVAPELLYKFFFHDLASAQADLDPGNVETLVEKVVYNYSEDIKDLYKSTYASSIPEVDRAEWESDIANGNISGMVAGAIERAAESREMAQKALDVAAQAKDASEQYLLNSAEYFFAAAAGELTRTRYDEAVNNYVEAAHLFWQVKQSGAAATSLQKALQTLRRGYDAVYEARYVLRAIELFGELTEDFPDIGKKEPVQWVNVLVHAGEFYRDYTRINAVRSDVSEVLRFFDASIEVLEDAISISKRYRVSDPDILVRATMHLGAVLVEKANYSSEEDQVAHWDRAHSLFNQAIQAIQLFPDKYSSTLRLAVYLNNVGAYYLYATSHTAKISLAQRGVASKIALQSAFRALGVEGISLADRAIALQKLGELLLHVDRLGLQIEPENSVSMSSLGWGCSPRQGDANWVKVCASNSFDEALKVFKEERNWRGVLGVLRAKSEYLIPNDIQELDPSDVEEIELLRQEFSDVHEFTNVNVGSADWYRYLNDFVSLDLRAAVAVEKVNPTWGVFYYQRVIDLLQETLKIPRRDGQVEEFWPHLAWSAAENLSRAYRGRRDIQPISDRDASFYQFCKEIIQRPDWDMKAQNKVEILRRCFPVLP